MKDKRKQPNDVEAVKPIGEIISREFTDTSILYTFIAGGNTELEQLSNVYSQQTIDQLQEKIAELSTMLDDEQIQHTSTLNRANNLEQKIAEINTECDERTQEVFDLQKEKGELLTVLTNTESKLKVAEEALEQVKNMTDHIKPEEHHSQMEKIVFESIQNYNEIVTSALDTIRKEQGDADKS